MGWLVILVGSIGPLATETVVDWFLGDGSYLRSASFQRLGAAFGAFLIYAIGRWLNDPARLEVRQVDTNELLGVRAEHTFCLIPFQWWAAIFPILYLVSFQTV